MRWCAGLAGDSSAWSVWPRPQQAAVCCWPASKPFSSDEYFGNFYIWTNYICMWKLLESWKHLPLWERIHIKNVPQMTQMIDSRKFHLFSLKIWSLGSACFLLEPWIPKYLDYRRSPLSSPLICRCCLLHVFITKNSWTDQLSCDCCKICCVKPLPHVEGWQILMVNRERESLEAELAYALFLVSTVYSWESQRLCHWVQHAQTGPVTTTEELVCSGFKCRVHQSTQVWLLPEGPSCDPSNFLGRTVTASEHSDTWRACFPFFPGYSVGLASELHVPVIFGQGQSHLVSFSLLFSTSMLLPSATFSFFPTF